MLFLIIIMLLVAWVIVSKQRADAARIRRELDEQEGQERDKWTMKL